MTLDAVATAGLHLHDQLLGERVARCSAVYCSFPLQEPVLSSLQPAEFRRARHQVLRSIWLHVFLESPTV